MIGLIYGRMAKKQGNAKHKLGGKPGLAPRREAATLLTGVLRDKVQMSDLHRSDRFQALMPDDRARAARLATTVLRHLGRIDALLAEYLKKSPPLPAQNLLRLGVIELLVDEAQPHGVIDSIVSLMKKTRKTAHLSGLANAVLRRVATNGHEFWQSAEKTQLPRWLRGRLTHVYGADAVARIEAAHETGAPIDLTIKGDAKVFADKGQYRLLPTGSVRIPTGCQVSALSGYAEGKWWVQDAASALPVKLLNPSKEDSVLDLCAAPGGKTLQLAALGAEVTAVDISAQRMARVQENLTRVGLKANTVITDALKYSAETAFDAILVDAPCSATGTIRRHPDLPHVKDGKDLNSLLELQAALLEHATSLLKPGGRLVYCTCSLLPEEGEAQAKRALETLGLKVLMPETSGLGIEPDWVDETGAIRTRPDYWPELGGMDGFYFIQFEKLKS